MYVYIIRLVDLKYSNAAGIVSAIKSSFESIGLTKDGVISILQRKLPWVGYLWCVAHRLELALKDALQGTIFDAIDEVLLRLYYLYENLPKKLRQLRDLHRMYSETFQFDQGKIRPKRACGNVWFHFTFKSHIHYFSFAIFLT